MNVVLALIGIYLTSTVYIDISKQFLNPVILRPEIMLGWVIKLVVSILCLIIILTRKKNV